MSDFTHNNDSELDAMGRPKTQPVIEVQHRDAKAVSDDGWEPVTIRRKLSLSDVKEKLAGKDGKQLWRSLDELAETPEFETLMREEFPRHHKAMLDVGRRDFMKMMGAGMALAGMSGCNKQPIEKIVPYVQPPEIGVPGKPLFYASALPMDGFGFGVLVESHQGRPTKLEGNEKHPASLGGTDARIQASVLDLYDPDRLQVPLLNGRQSTWPTFETKLGGMLADQGMSSGKGLRLLTGTVTSPTLNDQITRLKSAYPLMKWHQYDAVNRDQVRAGAEMAFGEVVDTVYDLTEADVVVTLSADLFSEGPARLRQSRDFAERRRVSDHHPKLNRVYAIETTPTLTGTRADHRLPLSPSQVRRFAHALSAEIAGSMSPGLDGIDEAFFAAVVEDLKSHKGKSVVVPGEQQPAELHALAHKINEALGNVGKTVRFIEPVAYGDPSQTASLKTLTNDMRSGDVEVLIMIESNPVYNAPRDLDFVEALSHVKHTAQLTSSVNETSPLVNWILPAAHSLTHWGDVKAFDGTVSILQPTILPLYRGKSSYELLALLLGEGFRGSDLIVQDYWKTQIISDFDAAWRRHLHEGIVPDSAAAAKSPSIKYTPDSFVSSEDGVEVVIAPDPSIHDGTQANNGWLQELPKIITTVTWDNVIMVSPAMARRESRDKKNGMQNGEELIVSVNGATIKGPVWVTPGHADDSVTLFLGYGRTKSGRVGMGKNGNGLGYNAYPAITSESGYAGSGGSLKETGKIYPLAATQAHHTIADKSAKNRNLIRTATTEEFKHHPEFAQHAHLEHAATKKTTLHPPYDYSKGEQWGMVIDLNTCIGCNACITACQAENNIPIVGKDEVIRGRELHWLRIDRYYEGDPENPSTHHQPVACFHCETAPCETVCPVGATTHSSDGLNQMVYNRCVGTRYCSNNCPYKVRRFNYFQYGDETTESLKFQRNPDVTVRVRGVMEKCTYCVQRISWNRIQSKIEDRSIRDGEVVTACQQACPTRAIAFGNINDPTSEVATWKKNDLNYTILSDLNTMPRTTHLAKLTNPNPVLLASASSDQHGDSHHEPAEAAASHGEGH